jgi:hypothetical protein
VVVVIREVLVEPLGRVVNGRGDGGRARGGGSRFESGQVGKVGGHPCEETLGSGSCAWRSKLGGKARDVEVNLEWLDGILRGEREGRPKGVSSQVALGR